MKENWIFKTEDLEKVIEDYKKKLEEIEKFRIYSKPQTKSISDYEKIKEIIKLIKLLQRKNLISKLLDSLNSEELKEKSFFDIFLIDCNKYFLKARISINYIKFKKESIDNLCFLPIIVQKLIANKLLENRIIESIPNRSKAIKDLIRFLRENLNNLENFQIIRADFKSYTLNIKRKKNF